MQLSGAELRPWTENSEEFWFCSVETLCIVEMGITTKRMPQHRISVGLFRLRRRSPSTLIMAPIILGVILQVVGIVTASSSGGADVAENDFRYISYHDLLPTSDRFTDGNVTSFSRLLFDVARDQVIVGAR